MAYKLLTSSPLPSSASTEYVQGDVTTTHTTDDRLGQYPYLQQLGADWLEQFDSSGLERFDEFLVLHSNRIELEPAAHDLAVWLLDYTVTTRDEAHWVVFPTGICAVTCCQRLLDPYVKVFDRLCERKEMARDFLEMVDTIRAQA